MTYLFFSELIIQRIARFYDLHIKPESFQESLSQQPQLLPQRAKRRRGERRTKDKITKEETHCSRFRRHFGRAPYALPSRHAEAWEWSSLILTNLILGSRRCSRPPGSWNYKFGAVAHFFSKRQICSGLPGITEIFVYSRLRRNDHDLRWTCTCVCHVWRNIYRETEIELINKEIRLSRHQ